MRGFPGSIGPRPVEGEGETKTAPRPPQDSPKRSQDDPRRPQDDMKKPQDSLKRLQSLPQRLQDQPKRLPKEAPCFTRPLQADPKLPLRP